MKRFILHLLATAGALAATAWLMPGITVASAGTLALASLALGVVNAVVRPILSILTLPVTVLTLGLFYLVVNAASFALAAWLVPGFDVAGFWPAVGGALLVSLLSTILGKLLGAGPDKPKRGERR